MWISFEQLSKVRLFNETRNTNAFSVFCILFAVHKIHGSGGQGEGMRSNCGYLSQQLLICSMDKVKTVLFIYFLFILFFIGSI